MADGVVEAGAGIRGELDILGYREPLPPDALPLVRRLLQDLKKTKEKEKQCNALLAETQEVSLSTKLLRFKYIFWSNVFTYIYLVLKFSRIITEFCVSV